jgi:crotonobetainyl-CoA:carnitine CoA-transferase CaiB-like acyl-CoA transferase
MLPLPFYLLKALDLTTGPAGACAPRYRPALGAVVVKLEDDARPDLLRADAAAFESLNRNKLSLSPDAGADVAELVLRLASQFDYVFLDDYDQRFDLDALREASETLIIVIVASNGPGAAETGIAAGAAAVAALVHRRVTGHGQRVEVDERDVDASLRHVDTDTGPVATASSLRNEPELQATFFEPVARHDGTFATLDGVPYRLSRTPGHVRTPAPQPGQHNEYLRGRFLLR